MKLITTLSRVAIYLTSHGSGCSAFAGTIDCAKANEVPAGGEKATKNQANEHIEMIGGRVSVLATFRKCY